MSRSCHHQAVEGFIRSLPVLFALGGLFLLTGLYVAKAAGGGAIGYWVCTGLALALGGLLIAHHYKSWKTTTIHLSEDALSIRSSSSERAIPFEHIVDVRMGKVLSWRPERVARLVIFCESDKDPTILVLDRQSAYDLHDRLLAGRRGIGGSAPLEELDETDFTAALSSGEWVLRERWSVGFEIFLTVLGMLCFPFVAVLAFAVVGVFLILRDGVQAMPGSAPLLVSIASIAVALWLALVLAKILWREGPNRLRQWFIESSRVRARIDRRFRRNSARAVLYFVGAGPLVWQVGKKLYSEIELGGQVLVAYKPGADTVEELYTRVGSRADHPAEGE